MVPVTINQGHQEHQGQVDNLSGRSLVPTNLDHMCFPNQQHLKLQQIQIQNYSIGYYLKLPLFII